MVATLGLVALWPRAVAGALGVPELAPWLWLLPIALLLTKASRLTEVWLTRMKRFRRVSGGQLAASGGTASFRISAGVASAAPGAGGLIGGFVIGQVASLALLLPAALKGRDGSGEAAPGPETTAPNLLSAARRYRRYALYSAPAAALNAAFTRLPIILLPLFFSWSVVGYFGRAFVALAVPLGLIGNAIAQVFFVHAGEAMRAGTLGGLTARVHGRLVMLGLLPTAAVIVAGPDLFEVTFGAPWRTSGEYVQLVAPWMFMAAVASPLTRTFDVLERQRVDLFTSIGMFIVQASAIVVGGMTGDVMLTLILLGTSGFLARAAHVATMLHLAGVSPAEAVRPYYHYARFALLPLLAIAVTARWAAPWATLIVTAVSGIAFYSFVAHRERLLPLGEEGAARSDST